MTTETKSKPSALPSRDKIDDKQKWDLTDIYASVQAWEDDYKKARTLIDKAPSFVGKLADSAATLYDCLQTQSDLGLIAGSLYQYAKLNLDLDNRQSKYQEMTDRAAMLASEIGAAFSYVEPELLKIDDDKLRALAAAFPKTDEYDFYVKDLIRQRKHVRSQEVEEVLAQASLIARGPDSIFTMLNDADLKYPSIKDEDGNEVQLTKQRFAKFMESTDRRVRKDAHHAFYSVYREHLNTLSASLSASVNKDIFYARTRKFDSALHSSLNSFNIPVEVYHSLLDTTEADLEGLHRYMSLRKRILKIDKVTSYDLLCPLFPDRDYEVEYDQAVETVLEAVKPLGEKYVSTLQDAFNSRWVDVWETEGKGSGAYSWGNYSAHPYVLMNYNNTVDNMFTLGHEMGHALHSFSSNATQPFPKHQYSIFVAEVASTLNEGLLVDLLLKKASDKLDKLYILNRQIDNTVGTFFNQVLYARFELMIHEHVEKGGALSPDMLNKLWGDLTQKFFGPDFEVDDSTPLKWSRIPHFYMTYYVYQYATSYAASQAILDKFLKGEEGIIDSYLKLLSAGGSDYPIELLKGCGVDMGTPDPVKANIRLFNDQVAQMDELTK